VAGPIERASNLLPQFLIKRSFNYFQAKEGMQLILWGLFKKIVIADNCAVHVNKIFENYAALDGSDLLLGGILFAFQIYGDFSGYSDIAIGVAALLGFSLMRNFAYPYFSRDIAEFWRRWHISLSTWFRDYVFIPLGGSRVTNSLFARNILATFTISGLWHGANWTFIIWGFLNGLYYFPLIFSKNRIKHTEIVAYSRVLPSVVEILQMLRTFLLTVLAWIFFRSQHLNEALFYLSGIFSKSLFTVPAVSKEILIILVLFVLIEWLQRRNKNPMNLDQLPKYARILAYAGITLLIVFYQVNTVDIEFIYFQF
jgi:D-alanyl-lipoteichoic acid acyltransferase DltB (MBOAT superfamily)